MHANECTVPSLGLHPWHLPSAERLAEELEALERQLLAGAAEGHERMPLSESAHSRDCKTATFSRPFVGECGLDRLCDTPYDLQLTAFEAQIQLSERLARPLVLHCVRAIDDALRLHRDTRQPWIWHGFRGKPQQLQQLLDHGFYVSFGLRYNTESLRQCPPERLFLETDDEPSPIAPLYEQAAALLDTTTTALNEQCWSNLRLLQNA